MYNLTSSLYVGACNGICMSLCIFLVFCARYIAMRYCEKWDVVKLVQGKFLLVLIKITSQG
jgi:hypothetical protein